LKLLIDMNLSPRWTGVLAADGHAPTHWSTVGRLDATDSEIMGYAAEHGFVVLTHDLDFGTLLAASRSSGPSVVQLRADDVSPEASAAAVMAALKQTENDLLTGALVTVDVARTRIRLLPLLRPDPKAGEP
jgi:predicted nuclease of predicted toxin-antitoxin system